MFLKTGLSNQRGVSLVELMVAIAIGLLITAAAVSAYIATSRSGSDTLRSAKLNMELRGAMDMMVAEIRRAGYYAGDLQTGNPFMGASTNLNRVNENCLLFAYDQNGNAAVDSADFFGFRLKGNAVSMRQGGTKTTDCTDGAWEGLTDPNSVVVDSLAFTVDYQCQNARTNDTKKLACASGNPVYDAAVASGVKTDLIELRTVTITLSGHHAYDSTMQMQLTQTVKVRNDRVLTVP